MNASLGAGRAERSGRVPAMVQAAISRHRLLSRRRPAVVGVSGGADSTCLLRVLDALGYPIVAAHLNHGLRGEEAEADARFVEGLCEELGIRCISERRDVAAYKERQRLSLEDAARQVRREFLTEVAARHDAEAIVLAHTADDQVETFLLRLIRGAGPAGLSSMKYRNGVLRRPMLGIWRREVEAYLRGNDWAWREDSSNRDPGFLRNRVRHELLPLLATFNPSIKEVLLRETAILASRQGRLEAELLRRLGLSSRQIEQALQGTVVMAAGGRRIVVEPGRPAQQEDFESELAVPGEIELPGVGRLTVERTPASSLTIDQARNRDETQALVDADGVGTSLRVRNWRRGDRFIPLGMTQEKKLQDFFVDAKVPRSQRRRVPIVTAGDRIVWLAGFRLDERFKITPATRRALRLTFRTGPS